MYIYLAGTPGIKQREREWQMKLIRRLLSYWDIQQEQFNVKYAFFLAMENIDE